MTSLTFLGFFLRSGSFSFARGNLRWPEGKALHVSAKECRWDPTSEKDWAFGAESRTKGKLRKVRKDTRLLPASPRAGFPPGQRGLLPSASGKVAFT